MSGGKAASVTALLSAPYGHRITRDSAGQSHVELTAKDGRTVTVDAATFDDAVFAALEQMRALQGAAL
jgi:hypothetical protein